MTVVSLLGCDTATHVIGTVPDDMRRAASAESDGTNLSEPDRSATTERAGVPHTAAWAGNIPTDSTATGGPGGQTVANSEPAEEDDQDAAGAGGPGPRLDDEPEGQPALVPVPLPVDPDAYTMDKPAETDPAETDPTSPRCLHFDATPRRLDMYMLVDRVVSLPLANPTGQIAGGLSSFVSSSEAEGTGAALLSVRNHCNSDLYPEPDVDWGLLPDNANNIDEGVRTLMFNVSHPQPAIEAAIDHARRRAEANPKWMQALVLVTDGFELNWCPGASSVLTEALVERALDGDPSIPTYVVALGTNTINPLEFLPGGLSLPDLARAGGTDAKVADIGGGADQVATALKEVRLQAQPCQYDLPNELENTTLVFDGDVLPKRGSLRACWRREGYYEGTGDASGFLVACSSTCERIRAVGHDKVQLGSNCQ